MTDSLAPRLVLAFPSTVDSLSLVYTGLKLVKVTPGVAIIRSICVMGEEVVVEVQSVRQNSCVQSTVVFGKPVIPSAITAVPVARMAAVKASPILAIQVRISIFPRRWDLQSDDQGATAFR